MFELERLKEHYEEAVGYPLKRNYGELCEAYREGNEVVFPVTGIYSVNPMVITAVREPFIGILSAELTVFAVPDRIDEVESRLNDVAAELSGSSFFIEDGGKRYAVTYSCQSATVGEKADIGWAHGVVFPITQVISYSIIENGLPASDISLEIDGHRVPFLSLRETRVHTSSVYPDEAGRGTSASEMSAYGIDFTVPLLTRDLFAEILSEHLDRDRGNRALCVGVRRAGQCVYRRMSILSISDSVQPPQNVGLNVSLAEISDVAAIYNGLWRSTEVYGSVIAPTELDTDGFRGTHVVVFWGDGSSEHDPKAPHFYTDGEGTHIVTVFDVEGDGPVRPQKGDLICGVRLTLGEIRTDTVAEDAYLLRTRTYEGLVRHAGRICVVLNDAEQKKRYYPIDVERADGSLGVPEGFTLVSPFRHKVSECSDGVSITYKRRELEAG